MPVRSGRICLPADLAYVDRRRRGEAILYEAFANVAHAEHLDFAESDPVTAVLADYCQPHEATLARNRLTALVSRSPSRIRARIYIEDEIVRLLRQKMPDLRCHLGGCFESVSTHEILGLVQRRLAG